MRIAHVQIGDQAMWVELVDDYAYELVGNRFDSSSRGRRLDAADWQVLAPIEPHNKIVALLGNFMGRGERQGPGFFFKPFSAVIDPGATIVQPANVSKFNFEAELGVVIGRRASRVPANRAMEYVWGYTVVNDVTSFPLMEEDGPLSTRWKAYDTFCPLGPSILRTAKNPAQLQLQARLNGEVKQDVALATMDFSVPEVLAWVSAAVTLQPGDIISMGTPPGFADIKPGDVIECEIESIGVLRNPVGS